jgi:hypothetical protein
VPVSNRPTPHLIIGKQGKGGWLRGHVEGEISPVPLPSSVGYPSRARHCPCLSPSVVLQPAGCYVLEGRRGQTPLIDPGQHALSLAITIDKSNRRFRRMGWRHPGHLRASRELVPPDFTSGDASPTGDGFMRQQGVVPLLCAESLL